MDNFRKVWRSLDMIDRYIGTYTYKLNKTYRIIIIYTL